MFLIHQDLTLKLWHIIPIKERVLKEMIEHFNIKQEDTLVIGIVIMIELCLHFGGYSVAMKNARQEIQEITNEVTQFTNEEDGLCIILRKQILK